MGSDESGDKGHTSRRDFLRRAGAKAASLVPGPAVQPGHPRGGWVPDPLRIGIIGSGRMGGALGLQWALAGHEIMFSSRHPERLADLAARAGPRAGRGLPHEAATFGEAVLIAVPYGELPSVGGDCADPLKNKVVIDCANPRADRDGPMADDAFARGTGVASAAYFPGVRFVRAFSALSSRQVEQDAHRAGEKIGVPISGDDEGAIRVVSGLVIDAGFDPVVVGPIVRAREFDRGRDVYMKGMTAAALRAALGLD